MARILGIDPGISGALAVLEGEKVHVVTSLPTRRNTAGKTELDAHALYMMVGTLRPDLAVLEQVHAQPGNGASASFSFGRSLGKIKAVLEIIHCAYIEPTPQAWKKVVLAGTDKSKEAAIGWAQSRFPGVNLFVKLGDRKPSHDMAEALCIAYYGLLHYRGLANLPSSLVV